MLQEGNAFDDARRRTLTDALALTPAARVALAEALWRELTIGRPPSRPWTAAFETQAEYEAWRASGRGDPG